MQNKCLYSTSSIEINPVYNPLSRDVVGAKTISDVPLVYSPV
jgi:hypothetical protein